MIAGICPIREELHSQLFDELIRQVSAVDVVLVCFMCFEPEVCYCEEYWNRELTVINLFRLQSNALNRCESACGCPWCVVRVLGWGLIHI